MEINTSNGVHGLETATKVSEVKREKDDTPGRQAAQTAENPDYRISLSDASKKAVTGLVSSQTPVQATENTELSDGEAVRLAEQTAEQLSQTNATISNQAMQKAVDLFT